MKNLRKSLAVVIFAIALIVSVSVASPKAKASNYKALIDQTAGISDGVNQAGVEFSLYDGQDYIRDVFVLFDFAGINNSLQFHDKANAAVLQYGVEQGLGFSTSDIIWGYMPNDVTPTQYWHNGVAQTSYKHLTFSDTTLNGSKVFYLTDTGTVDGNALCSTTPRHINVSTNDPGNTFGLGYVVGSDNKTLTITANIRTFTNVTILGQQVLFRTSLTPAPDGTPVSAAVDCNLL